MLTRSSHPLLRELGIFHPSIFGFNESTYPNRPQDPLINQTFDKWWFVSARTRAAP